MSSLTPNHIADLKRSGLDEANIDQSGIYSASAEEVAQILGRQDVGTGMIIPYPQLNGSPPFIRVKPDKPPIHKGRPAKYLTPKGAGNCLYVPRGKESCLFSASHPLLITEGEKKALKAAQEGFACIALSGVWCFRQRDKETGKSRSLPDLDHVEWGGRKVFIIYDSDIVDKLEVQRAECALAEELQRRGAIVRSVRLPVGPGGEKVGLDDFLVQYGEQGADRLRELMEQAQPPAVQQGIYRIENGCMGWIKTVGRGEDAIPVFTPLCNFVARVVEDRGLDDGAEVRRRFLVELTLCTNHRPLRLEVPAAQFASMSWVMREAGIHASITAGYGSQDRLRAAIQAFSSDAVSRYAYAHTGWRKVSDAWTYLHAGRTDLEVVLDGKLKSYSLPEQPDRVSEAVRQSYSLLNVAPHEVTIPLLAAVYLALLYEWLHPDFVLFLVGPSGTHKSTLAALFMSHYGAFVDKSDLPGSWESTDNALEKLLFTLKDVLVCVDDYAPRADLTAQRRQAGRAQRIIRGAGNISGRGRMNADGSLRPDYPPRGLLLSTGEDLPPGQSILARMLSVEVDLGSVDLKLLTQAQAQADRLPHAFAGYVEWLAPRLDELADDLRGQFVELRNLFAPGATHGRIPEILAYLALGLNLFVQYAVDSDALSSDEGKELTKEAVRVLQKLGAVHGARIGESDPAEVFLSTLSSLLAAGNGQLAQKGGSSSADGQEILGWKDDKHAYLIPDAAVRAVNRFLRDRDHHFSYTNSALYKALDGRGVLIRGSDGKSTRSITIGGKKQRVLTIPLNSIEPAADESDELDN